MLTSGVCRCEFEHSHLHTSLFSARPCRATPFKREKDSNYWSRKKLCRKMTIRFHDWGQEALRIERIKRIISLVRQKEI
jgi:hypothetical protein